MKLSKFIIALALTAVTGTSCNDYLDEEIVSGATAGSYIVDANGLTGVVNAAYAPLRTYYGQELGFVLTEFGVDTYTHGRDGSFIDVNQYNPGLSPSLSILSTLWTNFYKGISTCNTAIDRAPAIGNITDQLRSQRVAEARYLRALYYFVLVQTFGDIPLSLNEIKDVRTETIRVNAEKIYTDAILPDLEYAVTNLPRTQSDYGRATQAAAKMLLARVQMVRKNWVEVEKLSNSVIKDYNFSLQDSYSGIFDINNQKNSEVIWAVNYNSTALLNGTGNQSHLYFIMVYDGEKGMQRDILNGRPFNRFKLTPYGNSLFDNKADKRYVEGFQRVYYANNRTTAPAGMNLGDTAVFITTDIVPASVRATKKYAIYDLNDINSQTVRTKFLTNIKFLDPKRSSVTAVEGSKDFIVFRIAEAYLNLAEAQLMQSRPDDATATINILRKKRSMPGFDLSIGAGQMNMEFILDERGRELYGEMQRWFDLKRTGTLIERVKKYNPDAMAGIKDYHVLRPIPQSEIDRSSNKVDQNLGYN
ncbi:RagB/SusD family nutrient uptake outer membrane protein [Desertivirga arenae]|uniref:RagB/SusD family nutrient uptake outer membrane protein n=1 Tax=Desertivirga arenae TaxID=2810309 RepID=UPI001A961200|nr:RagB/SusD family nutrient uptake outer membrane protein [Pedobacter sp. SYSU D00823]